MPLGFHLSISRGLSWALKKAEELGCDILQIFSRNPRGWRRGEISEGEAERFREDLMNSSISTLILHTSYLTNLATSDEEIYRLSIGAIKEDMERALMIDGQMVVTHIGSTKGGSRSRGISRVVKALEEIGRSMDGEVRLLLENSSGSGYHVGWSVEEIGEILRPFRGNGSIGFCLDTCHAFAAGYPIHEEGGLSRLLEGIQSSIGMERLHLLHLNDSKGDLGSRVDRHEHIGRGRIGTRGFRIILNHPLLRELPMILETPRKSDEDDRRNMRVVRRLMKGGVLR